MTNTPVVEANVTFLRPDEGGRNRPAIARPDYMPHIVMGDPDQRVALVDEDNQSLEHYLGVAFQGDGEQLTPGVVHHVRLVLIHHPRVDYSRMQLGASFNVREGGKVVGFGVVINTG